MPSQSLGGIIYSADRPSEVVASRPDYADDRLLELAVVVPTYNELENIDAVICALQTVLAEHAFEVIVVDDNSPDGTANRVREIAQRNSRVHCIQRIGRRGLSSAFVEGALATAAPIVAIIDGDMQHDENLLPAMLKTLISQDLDVVVASRYLDQGDLGNWTESRIRASRFATALTRRFTQVALSDPMSGFFMIRSEVLRAAVLNLSAVGFKILLDIFMSAPKPLRYVELPHCFRARSSGSSKMDAKVLLDFAELLIDKFVGRIVPAKFVLFSLVGSLGVGVHLVTLAALFAGLGFGFATSQIVATLMAMTANFALNNVLTYHDRRLRGWNWLKGWFSFAFACSIGAIANVGVATYLFGAHLTPWLVSGLAGIVVGVVWNYAVTSLITWKRE